MTDHPSGEGPTRRTVVRLGALALGGLVAPPALTGCSGIFPSGGGNNSAEGSAGGLLESEVDLPQPFRVPLPVPDVLAPVHTDGTTDYYEITQRPGEAEILPGRTTEVWGYEGTFPGPTLVSRRGRRTVVRHRNDLPVPTVVHLHGGVTAPEHDGFPTDLVLPGSDREYVYEVDQPAATLWYHDHRMDFTGPQVYRGLAGFHLVHDEHEESLGLPSGDRDIPLLVCDRAFGADGSFAYPSVDDSLTGMPGVTSDFMSGVLGDCILVNGAPWPVLEVAAVRYRFRILNASNARRYRLRLDGGPSFVQIGSDLGLLAAPIEHEEIDIAQAERFDVVVDFSGHRVGDEITLVNERGRGSTAEVMRFVVTREEADDSTVPGRLADLETLTEADAVAEREFVLQRGGAEAHGMTLWTVNGEAFGPDTSVARPRLGTVEKWTIRGLNVEHPFHIHLAPFQVLSANGDDEPGPYNAGWKDTVNLDNGGRAEILLRFDGYRGRYVFHCHNLEHEDMMMMATFEVV